MKRFLHNLRYWLSDFWRDNWGITLVLTELTGTVVLLLWAAYLPSKPNPARPGEPTYQSYSLSFGKFTFEGHEYLTYSHSLIHSASCPCHRQ